MSRWKPPARLIVLLGLFLSPLLVSALDVPPLTGRVVDLAGVLPVHDSDALANQLKTHEENTGNQVAVLILPSLDGEPLEEYSHRVATTWKLGQKGKDNGALLLIALKERKLRIEVGYGLEGALTDLRSSRIIRQEIVPRFKAGDIPGGVRAGTDAILKTIEGTYQTDEESQHRAPPVASALHYVVIGIIVGVLAGLILSQGLRRARALLGAVLSFMVAQAASIPWGLIAAGVTAVFLWSVLSAGGRRRRPGRFDDWTWYSSGGGGWSGGGSFGNGGFSGGGGDFGGGGASGDW
ncbi:MAG TPA: TPM domain-containing protein [Nitrospira sp.]|nr:TPM domain-containing protein [Nitrospira sp.]